MKQVKEDKNKIFKRAGEEVKKEFCEMLQRYHELSFMISFDHVEEHPFFNHQMVFLHIAHLVFFIPRMFWAIKFPTQKWQNYVPAQVRQCFGRNIVVSCVRCCLIWILMDYGCWTTFNYETRNFTMASCFCTPSILMTESSYEKTKFHQCQMYTRK